MMKPSLDTVPKRIGIDGRGVRPQPDGIGHATLRLVEGLLRVNRDLELTIWILPEAAARFPRSERIRLIPCSHHHLSRFTLKSFGRWVDRERLDLFHAPFFLAPLRCRTPMVVTVHDLMALDDDRFFDGMFWRFKRRFHRRYVPRVIQRAQRTLCVSETVAERVRCMDVSEERVVAVHHGLDADLWRRPPNLDVRRQLDALELPDRFFLHVGRWRPYKDIPTLFAGFRTYLDRTRRKPMHLVCCRGGGDRSYERLLDEYGLRDTVRIVDAPEDAVVGGLLHLAAALVQPSRYEGFGLPVLEAMASDTPTIVSRAGALEEVVGDAGLLFDVGDHPTLAGHLDSLSTDPDRCRDLVEKGRGRVQTFTLERMARATLQTYSAAVAPLAFSDAESKAT